MVWIVETKRRSDAFFESMKCPTCATPDLVMADKNGVEIDYCPQCRGVWLDRGELDKIVARSQSLQSQGHDRDDDDDYRDGKRRKKNWLMDIFD